jgi:asparagine synthase (glutamine-hydrolysing)
MCGIAGILGKAARSEGLLHAMGGSIVHRGPDDQGIFADPEAGLALIHRRLAILDLSSAGHQPMKSSNGRFVLCFNGEIYNHLELRRELEESGLTHNWRGHSDTETLLAAISTWGLQPTLERSVGMFAFALWDRQERTLQLARDRFGEKPLYYGWAGTDFLFASELKALRLHPRFFNPVSRDALALFTARGYVPAPWTIYEQIFKLMPGCILTVTPESPPRCHAPKEGFEENGIRLDRYWSHPALVRAGLVDPIEDEHEAIERLEHALETSVCGQSIADVPIGAFLSGGIDSSTVIGLYQRYSAQPVRTFTIGFSETAYNEADYARRVAKAFGTAHHEQIVTPRDALDIIPDMPRIYDEPFADSSQIPTFLVSRFAREQVSVALSGDGGDELFGGYTRYTATARAWGRIKSVPWPLRSIGGAIAGRIPSAIWDWVGVLANRGDHPGPDFGLKVRKSLRTIGRARHLEDAFVTLLDEWAGESSPVLGAGNVTAHLRPFEQTMPGASDALRMMSWDAVDYLPDDILCKVDRAAMAVGLETRVPFLDHRVAEVAARLPMRMKIEGRTGKAIVRKLLYDMAPRELFERPKAGFGVPVGEWIKGPLRPWAEELLDKRRVDQQGFFDANLVHRRWQDHLRGRRDSTTAIWSILMFQAWLGVSEGATATSVRYAGGVH